MGSVTSCFNPTLYHKSLARFWPLWALYGLLWLFLIPLRMLNGYFELLRWGDSLPDTQEQIVRVARSLPDLLDAGVAIAAVFGVLCAMAVFGYLYTSRSACMMHALPLRREGLFLTQYLSGLSFSLLPHVAVALLTLAVEMALIPAEQWRVALPPLAVWLLAQSGVSLFFFSFAAFCAMFTGHILALPVFYGILNILVYVLYTLFTELMRYFFFGYAASSSLMPAPVYYCTPIYCLSEACSWQQVVVTLGNTATASDVWQLASPLTVLGYAVAGLVLALLALMVYRYRHVESAGDVVAIALVRPLFKYGVALCAGLCLGIFTYYFFNWSSSLTLSLCVLVWAAVGYFAAEMLLRKSFRVLRAWKGCAVTVAVLAMLCLAFFLDAFNVEGRVPQPGEVASITVSGDWGPPYDDGDLRFTSIDDPADIEQFIALHRAIVDDRDRVDYSSASYLPGDSYLSLDVVYYLSDGGSLEREYNSIPIYRVETDQVGSVTWAVQQLIRDRELVEQIYGFDACEPGRLVEAYLSDVYYLPDGSGQGGESGYYHHLDSAAGEDLMDLWRAVRADFDDGTIGVRYLFDDAERQANTYRTDLTFSFALPAAHSGPAELGENYLSLTITLTPNASRTLTWLRELGGLGAQYGLVSQDGETYDTGLSDPAPIPVDGAF